jgi:hypothetical protein
LSIKAKGVGKMNAASRFQSEESSLREQVTVRMVYVDITGDLISGILLSQIVYWHIPSRETGKPKLKVFKEGHLWLAKERSDWWTEIRITDRQYDRAIKILIEKELVEVKKFKFNGMPMIHIRLLYDNLESLINQENRKLAEKFEENNSRVTQSVIPELTKGESRNNTLCNTGVAESVTLLTEITNRDYNIDYLQNDDDDEENRFEVDIIGFGTVVQTFNQSFPNLFSHDLWNRIYKIMVKQRIPFITLLEAIEQAQYMQLRKEQGEIIGDYAAYFVGGIIKKRKSEASALNQQNIAKATKKRIEEQPEPTVPFYDWLTE